VVHTPTDRHRLTVDEAVLVVIDMQERLLPAIARNESISEQACKLIRFAKIAGIPVLVTEQQNLGATVPDISDLLDPATTVSKIEFSCFDSMDFQQALSGIGRKGLLLTGIETHICVAQTALFAPGDFLVQVVEDAVSSRHLSDKDMALQRLRQSGVTVTTTEMAIFEILEQAGTDLFKKTLPLIKG
jgi:isochorismate hydrolase